MRQPNPLFLDSPGDQNTGFVLFFFLTKTAFFFSMNPGTNVYPLPGEPIPVTKSQTLSLLSFPCGHFDVFSCQDQKQRVGLVLGYSVIPEETLVVLGQQCDMHWFGDR